VTLLDRDNFLGRILTGKVQSGTVKVNRRSTRSIATARSSKPAAPRRSWPSAGLSACRSRAQRGRHHFDRRPHQATVANTIADLSVSEPLQAQPIDPPTLSMRFAVNDSPMAGREGSKVTSRMIRDRLMREAESNVAIRVTESADKDSFEVAGRGELQLGVLIETMRREGFELGISRPRVLFAGRGGQAHRTL
jgi:GTP-binding protein